MKRLVSWIVMLGSLVSTTHADWFVDDFERADTAFTNDASVSIGDGYVLTQLAGEQQTIAKITSGKIEFSQTDGSDPAKNIILYNSNIELTNAQSNESFTVEGDIQTINVLNGSSLQGLAFNLQPDGSFYAARIDTGTNDTTVLQFIRADSNGSIAQFTTIANSVPLATNSVYHLKISSLEPGAFNYELTGPDLDGGQLVGSAQDTSLELQNGYAGFFASASFGTEGYAFDNLSIETVTGGTGSFADSYTRANSSFNADPAVSIGTGYVRLQLSGAIPAVSRIWANQIQVTQSSWSSTENAKNILWYYTGAEMQNSGSNAVSIVEGDIQTINAVNQNKWYGLAFNVQPDGSYYAARINTGNTNVLQFIRVTSAGAISSFGAVAQSSMLPLSSTYHFKIEAFSPGAFRYTVTGPGLDGGILSGIINDTALELSDGYAGFYTSDSDASLRFDSLSIKNITVGETAGFVDDYTRALSTFDSDASVSIGPGYVFSQSGGTVSPYARVLSYGIQLNQYGDNTTQPVDVVLRQTGVDTMNVSGQSFVIEGDIRTIQLAGSTFYGLAFNYQPDGSYYAARINTGSEANALQFIRVTSAGDVTGFANITNSVLLPLESWYHLKIESDTAGVFKYRLTGPDLDGGVLTGIATDTELQLEDGEGGFYASKCSTQIAFDNLSIGTYTTEILAGYDLWADGWGVDLGAMTADYDGDQVSNFAEYALGGNPTNALDSGEAPSLTLDGSGLTYVYPQRSDDATLAYIVKTTDDLVSGVWTNSGYSVIDTNVTGSTLDYVTNTVPVIDPQLFIKLEINQN